MSNEYDNLKSLAEKLQKRYLNNEKIKKIKDERWEWWQQGLTCDCELSKTSEPWDGDVDQYGGTCEFCVERNEFHHKIKLLGNENRGLSNSIRRSVMNMDFSNASDDTEEHE